IDRWLLGMGGRGWTNGKPRRASLGLIFGIWLVSSSSVMTLRGFAVRSSPGHPRSRLNWRAYRPTDRSATRGRRLRSSVRHNLDSGQDPAEMPAGQNADGDAADVEPFKIFERRQPFDGRAGHGCAGQTDPVEALQLQQMLDAAVRDCAAGKIKMAQVLQVARVRRQILEQRVSLSRVAQADAAQPLGERSEIAERSLHPFDGFDLDAAAALFDFCDDFLLMKVGLDLGGQPVAAALLEADVFLGPLV